MWCLSGEVHHDPDVAGVYDFAQTKQEGVGVFMDVVHD